MKHREVSLEYHLHCQTLETLMKLTLRSQVL